jgi:hypothetical protein
MAFVCTCHYHFGTGRAWVELGHWQLKLVRFRGSSFGSSTFAPRQPSWSLRAIAIHRGQFYPLACP